MSNYDDLLKQAMQIESKLDELGVKYPKRCHSCGDFLKDNQTIFCQECHDIMEKELADGNIYIRGNVKRQQTKKIHIFDE